MQNYVYLSINYFATGEGVTKYLLVTRAYPTPDDYEVEPSFGPNFEYNPGILKSTPEQIATNEMKKFGIDPYFMQGVESHTYDNFMKRYDKDIPEYVKNIIKLEGDDIPANFQYFSAIHYNFS